MAADSMPLMLSDNLGAMGDGMHVGLQDVDVDDVDLFGGPVDLGLPPQQPPPSKQLQMRVDEMRTRGCSQRIGWSRQGTIASIGADGQSIDVRYLRTDPRDGSWGLSEPTHYAQFSHVNTVTTFSGGPIVHLAWAATGHPELAVIDAVGRVSILAFTLSLNRPFPLRSWELDPVDDLHAVVGCYWLPLIPHGKQAKYHLIHGPAVREDHGYRYDNTGAHAFGPYHPNASKSSLLCVTAGGTLRLLYPQSNNAVQETSMELESITSSDDLATHASICSEKGNSLLIALATASRQLKVVRAAIHWNLPPHDKQVPPHTVQLNPMLQQKPAAVTTWLQHGAGELQLDISADQISHLEVLSSAAVGPNQPWSPPLVLTVRTYMPTPNTSPYQQPDAQSIIDRWELLVDTPPQPLHPAFEQVGIKPRPQQQAQAQANATGLTRLHKLEPIFLNKVVVAVHTIQFGKVVCFAFSDGTVQYRDRFTMQEIYTEPNHERIFTLQEANFHFTDNVAEYAAVVAGLTTTMATAQHSQSSYDDVLAVARQFVDKPRFAFDWMMEIVRMLKINVDYSEEAHHDQLVRNHALHSCFSILNHMGFRGEFKPRAFCGKFAMLTMNVRNIVILITIASNTPGNSKDRHNPLDEPDVVDALAGCAKWALDLLAYIADCVFNLLDDPAFMALLSGHNFNELAAYLQEKNDVALHLLLCSSTRGFLSAVCRRLLHLDSISARATQYYEQQQQQQAAAGANGGAAATAGGVQRPALILPYQKMQQYTSSSLIKVQEFDKLLLTLGEEIRQTYQAQIAQTTNATAGNGQKTNGGKAKQQAPNGQQQNQTADANLKRLQAHCELTLLLGNNPPPKFQPMLQKFFSEHLRAFRAQTDPAKLYFADYSILEVEDDEHSLRTRRMRHSHVDVFKRVELTMPTSGMSGHGGGGGGGGGGVGGGGGGGGSGGADATAWPPTGLGATGLWRRCARCTAIMEDVAGLRPAYMFVLAQQRNRRRLSGPAGAQAALREQNPIIFHILPRGAPWCDMDKDGVDDAAAADAQLRVLPEKEIHMLGLIVERQHTTPAQLCNTGPLDDQPPHMETNPLSLVPRPAPKPSPKPALKPMPSPQSISSGDPMGVYSTMYWREARQKVLCWLSSMDGIDCEPDWILALNPHDETGGTSLKVGLPAGSALLADAHLGDSIAINGCCLTVTAFDATSFQVGIAPETLRLTNLGDLAPDTNTTAGHNPNSRVNLERAVRADTRMGGHFVQGHVDTVARVTRVAPDGNAQTMRFAPRDRSVLRYVVHKGFVALDGTSLTVTAVNDQEGWWEVMLIAYTQSRVALAAKREGDTVNVEVDVLAKYAEKSMAGYLETTAGGDGGVKALVQKAVADALAAQGQ
ncbi:RNA polymerase 2 mediator complex subunit [Niveomyces insectorum RCEF 264]|uniref:Mediator of RNA polymerase II transcription subunit 16 n=1 Tax=Niveomyces insectorum RCEF 264 TaxID=1081102 RepID=A0A167U571_9HYPO|nr:RNA polymerase 2 mediator complex subunit [Niveomyces insectorum RCEF 264]